MNAGDGGRRLYISFCFLHWQAFCFCCKHGDWQAADLDPPAEKGKEQKTFLYFALKSVVFGSIIDTIKDQGGSIMAAITKESTIGEVLARDMQAAKYFMEIGMHCLGCPHSQAESIEEACMVHGTDVDELLGKLKQHFGE